MSNISRIESEIESLYEKRRVIDEKLEELYVELHTSELSEDEKNEIKEEMEELEETYHDISLDIACLQELLHKSDDEYEEDEEHYDGWNEILTDGDY